MISMFQNYVHSDVQRRNLKQINPLKFNFSSTERCDDANENSCSFGKIRIDGVRRLLEVGISYFGTFNIIAMNEL